MILYKLNEINERIEEMKGNIKTIKENAENEIQEDIQKYRSEKGNIESSKDLSTIGKDNQINRLSHSYYDKYVKKGIALAQKIEEEYNNAISRVKELKQFDDERKIVKSSKADMAEVMKQNTDLLYAMQILSNIDDKYNQAELIKLFDNNQECEKILTLIKIKCEDLQRKGVRTDEINKLMSTLNLFDTDYAAKLGDEKTNSITYCKNVEYPRVITSISLRDLFEVDKTDISQFSALNKVSQEGISRFAK